MSEQIPESIPTSADPRSKRPTKKRALSPKSQTAAQLDALFAKPDQEIRIPSTSSALSHTPGSAPPEIVQNVQGSSAGAGSGEFHVYKASRRREYERLRGMEEEVRNEEDGEKWERERREREERDREKTRKNREKRERLKNKGKKGKGGKEGGEVQQAKGGKFKARVDVGKRPEGLGGEGPEDGEGMAGVVSEEAGIVIHDDD
ncbi:uncharacterized protein K444DRAFT_618855 [Hyaloscypha bicolor E]|jgi:Protein of unknown function (DUF1168)|uniref:DUF1168-domain-containing protein n=1 Tax=Hyaloscypha bicolor E TaxID=1095630 RepID=A0A2J6SSD6_9HELO|nr:uncharacterized protein K444DRAFT_618855 [Hyaloscypha bicolor E]PMD53677.1 hypothetical protein K444DRAFT_618855 [Hyaloscypha bicolor E]